MFTSMRTSRTAESGVTAIEYAILVSIVAIACIPAIAALTGALTSDYREVATSISGGQFTTDPEPSATAPSSYIETLPPGKSLTVGDTLTSPAGTFVLTVNQDGSLVNSQTSDGTTVWTLNRRTVGTPHLDMRSDGNLAMYDGPGTGTLLWESGTASYPGAYLQLDDDGALRVIFNGITVWAA